jgi:hypothetical protein
MKMGNRIAAGSLALVVTITALGGCSPAVSEPTPTTNPYQAACADFAHLTYELYLVVRDGAGSISVDEWHAKAATFVGRFDELSLETTGDVATRIGEVSKSIPYPAYTLIMNNSEYRLAVEAVGRACEAGGITKSHYTNLQPGAFDPE